MIVGTTPYHRFNLPIDPSLIDKIYITYSQNDRTVFEKSNASIEYIEGDTPGTYKAQVHLSQVDTLKFKSGLSNSKIEIQMTILTLSGDRLSSKPVNILAGKTLKEEMI